MYLFHRPFSPSHVLCCGLVAAGLLASRSVAQAQTTIGVTSTTPARHARGVARASDVKFQLNSTPGSASLSNFKVYSAQRGGAKAGSYSSSGLTVTFNTTADFGAGEEVLASIPNSVRSFSGSVGVAKQVFEFTTETAGGGTFGGGGPTVSAGTGSAPYATAAADMDEDGHLDLLLADAATGQVRLRFNNGTGTAFSGTASVALGAGSAPHAVANADVNNDGHLDLLTANSGAGTVSVRLGDGTGNFFGTTNLTVGTGPEDVVTGDFNADARLDFAVSLRTTGQVALWLGDGAGGFSLHSTAGAGLQPKALAVGDVDNDGDQDVVAANSGDASVSVLANDGNGTLALLGTASVGGAPADVVLGDLNGDGNLDLLTCNSSGVSVRLNNGSGTFAGSTSLSVSGARALALGDLDGDTDLDLAVASFDNDLVALRYNNGTGNLSGSGTVAVGDGPNGLLLADLTRDGALDVLTANHNTTTASVRTNAIGAPVLSSISPGSATIGSSVVIQGTQLTGVSAVKFNGVTATYTVDSPTQITATVPAGASTGALSITSTYGTGSSSGSFLVVPALMSYAPGSAQENTAGVVITGTGFVGVTSVKFNGVTASYTVNSSTQITATVPVGATTGPVSVTTAGGTGTGGSFTVQPGISSFSPASGTVGTVVTLSGSNLTGATQVRFNGVSAAFTVNSATSITATVPATATTGLIDVTTPADGTRSSSTAFGVLAGISSFTPTTGGAGATVVLTGTTFVGVTGVSFNGVSATYTINSSTQITAVVPAGATSGYIVVSNAGGAASSSAVFSLPAIITSFSPASGVGGSGITLSGSSFLGTSDVRFNGVSAPFTVNANGTEIATTVPNTALSGPLSITTPAGTYASSTAFAVLPALTGVVPAGAAAGTQVVLNGTGLTNLTGLTFNGVAATSFALLSATQIRVTVPVGATSGLLTAAVSGTAVSLPFVVRAATVASVSPGRNAQHVPRATSPAVTFSQAQASGAAPAQLRVFSRQQGLRAGTYAGAGTATSTFAPAVGLRAGELVHVTAPNAAFGVQQFTAAATGPCGTLAVPVAAAGSTSGERTPALGDLDGDGDLDLVAVRWYYQSSNSTDYSDLTVALNDGTGQFVAATSIAMTGHSYYLTLGDLDNDGDLDVAVSNNPDNSTRQDVRLYLNAGGGTLTYLDRYAVSFSGAARKSGVELGDVDGDGDLDLVGHNDMATGVGLNDGTGRMSWTTRHLLGIDGYGLQALGSCLLRDMDQDGDLDLILGAYDPNGGNSGGYVLGVYPNDGLGSFAATPLTYLGVNTSNANDIIHSLSAADFNGDGFVDVSAHSQDAMSRIFLNNGAGGLSEVFSASDSGLSTNHDYALPLDADADGDLDLLTRAGLRLNNGSGSFGGLLVVGSGFPAVGDVDNDGDVDVVLTSGIQATTYLNHVPPIISSFTPQGSAGAPVSITGQYFDYVSAVKINGVAATFTRVSASSITLTVPAGASTGPLTVTTPWGTASSATSFTVLPLATLTPLSPARNARAATRATDVALTLSSAPTAATADVRVFGSRAGGRKAGAVSVSGTTLSFNPMADFKAGEQMWVTAPGTILTTSNALLAKQVYQFTAAVSGGVAAFSGGSTVAVGSNPVAVAAADVDGDGDLDLLTANAAGNTVSLSLNSGPATFVPSTSIGVDTNPLALAAADVDGDGDLDLLTANGTAGTLSIRLNTGGTFGGSLNLPVGSTPSDLAVGDLDGDGDLDVATANRGAGTLSVCLNDGSGAFAVASAPAVGSSPRGVAAADVDGDGDLDLLAANYAVTGTVSLLLNGGGGTFGAATSIAVAAQPEKLVLADVDADLDLDLLVLCSGDEVVSLRLNTAGAFGGGTNLAVGSAPKALAVGDVDGDQDLDVLVANNSLSGTVSIRLNNGSGAFTATADASVSSGPAGLLLADFDGDDDLDLATANSNGGTGNTLSVRLNQNAPPVITAFSPASGPAGTSVVLTGTSFLSVASVRFNGVTASFVVNSSTQLTVVVPVGATTGLISVTTATGTGTSAASFTVLQVYNSTLNQCLTTGSITSTGSGQWQYLLASNGQLVAAVNDGGQALGTVYAEFTQASLAAVRADASGREYLDRNWHLVAQNTFAGSAVQVRLFGLNTELTRFIAANDGDANDVTGLGGLRLTQYSGNNENCSWADNTGPTEVRLLTPTATEQLSGGTWFSVTATVADHFSEFYLNGGSTPLPVELVRFTAERRQAAALLRWATAQELRNERFEVEASADGRTFWRVGTVAGHGSSTQRHAYEFTDADLPRYAAALVYYRLRQVDADGTASYSPVRPVQAPGAAAARLTLYPNPAHEQVRVGGLGEAPAVDLVDALGRVLRTHAAPAPGQDLLLSLGGLPAGVYLVRAGAECRRLVVE